MRKPQQATMDDKIQRKQSRRPSSLSDSCPQRPEFEEYRAVKFLEWKVVRRTLPWSAG